MWEPMSAERDAEDTARTDIDDEIRQIAFAEQARRPLPEDDCAEHACKALAELGYEGLRDDEAAEGVEPDPMTAWKRKLEREGKRNPDGSSLGRRVVDAARLE
jgi:hypothetical protein